MGLRLFNRSSSSYDRKECTCTSCKCKDEPLAKGNPDPYNFTILNSFQANGHVLLLVQYPDCTNYEGKKILLYTHTSMKELNRQKHLDPHFSNNKLMASPFARFEPTKVGWLAGKVLMVMLNIEPNSPPL